MFPVFSELSMALLDFKFKDGFERVSFDRAIRHVITRRFRWPMAVAEAAIYLYTDHTHVDNAYVNRRKYIEVRNLIALIHYL